VRKAVSLGSEDLDSRNFSLSSCPELFSFFAASSLTCFSMALSSWACF
jgi:hypothetical protein